MIIIFIIKYALIIIAMQKKHFNIKDVSKNFKNNLSLLLK